MCTLTLNNKIRCTLITSTNLINIRNYFFYVINILLPGEIMSWMKYVYILVLQFKGIQLKKRNCIKLFYINPLSQKCCVLTAISNSAWKMKNFKVCIVKSSTALQVCNNTLSSHFVAIGLPIDCHAMACILSIYNLQS